MPLTFSHNSVYLCFVSGMTTSWSGNFSSWWIWTRIRGCWSCSSWRSWSASLNPMKHIAKRCSPNSTRANSGSSGMPNNQPKTFLPTCDSCETPQHYQCLSCWCRLSFTPSNSSKYKPKERHCWELYTITSI